jgi:hydrogenase nickel incorporation protein HypA/HybF
MHEASIAQAILETALTAMKEKLPSPSARITRIVVVAGVLAGVERECLKTFFDIISEGTPAAGAEIELRPEPAKLICRQCGHTTLHNNAEHVEVNCPQCGGENKLEGGHELYVDSLEAEDN